MRSLRRSLWSGLNVALLMLAFALTAWGQASNSVEQQFAAFHERLSGAADDLLAARAPTTRKAADNNVAPMLGSIRVSDRFNDALMRVQQLQPLLAPILREEEVPTDVAAMVLIESGGRVTALSPKGALGIWQLMPETARRYGLTVSPDKDERLDVLKATRAAARYVRDLYAQFGDWRLAFAAYNAGEQTIQKAIRRSGSADFHRLSILLPAETQAYVPAVMAARPLFGNSHDFTLPTLRAARAAQVLYASARLDN